MDTKHICFKYDENSRADLVSFGKWTDVLIIHRCPLFVFTDSLFNILLLCIKKTQYSLKFCFTSLICLYMFI